MLRAHTITIDPETLLEPDFVRVLHAVKGAATVFRLRDGAYASEDHPASAALSPLCAPAAVFALGV